MKEKNKTQYFAYKYSLTLDIQGNLLESLHTWNKWKVRIFIYSKRKFKRDTIVLDMMAGRYFFIEYQIWVAKNQ